VVIGEHRIQQSHSEPIGEACLVFRGHQRLVFRINLPEDIFDHRLVFVVVHPVEQQQHPEVGYRVVPAAVGRPPVEQIRETVVAFVFVPQIRSVNSA